MCEHREASMDELVNMYQDHLSSAQMVYVLSWWKHHDPPPPLRKIRHYPRRYAPKAPPPRDRLLEQLSMYGA